MTYTYEVFETGELIDVEQRITDQPHEWRVAENGHRQAIRRVISAAAPVHFKDGPTGGWASTGYSKRPHERKAEQTLGRPLTKAAR